MLAILILRPRGPDGRRELPWPRLPRQAPGAVRRSAAPRGGDAAESYADVPVAGPELKFRLRRRDEETDTTVLVAASALGTLLALTAGGGTAAPENTSRARTRS